MHPECPYAFSSHSSLTCPARPLLTNGGLYPTGERRSGLLPELVGSPREQALRHLPSVLERHRRLSAAQGQGECRAHAAALRPAPPARSCWQMATHNTAHVRGVAGCANGNRAWIAFFAIMGKATRQAPRPLWVARVETLPAQVLGSLNLAEGFWMRSSGLVDERTAVRCSGRDTVGNGVKPFPEGKPITISRNHSRGEQSGQRHSTECALDRQNLLVHSHTS